MALVPGGYLEEGGLLEGGAPPLWLVVDLYLPAAPSASPRIGTATATTVHGRPPTAAPPKQPCSHNNSSASLSSSPSFSFYPVSHTTFLFSFFCPRFFLTLPPPHLLHPLYFPSRGLSLFLVVHPLPFHPSRHQHPQRGVQVTGSVTLSRLQAAIRLYKAGSASHCLFTSCS